MTCNYSFKIGKKKGQQCTRKISSSCPNNLYCYQHKNTANKSAPKAEDITQYMEMVGTDNHIDIEKVAEQRIKKSIFGVTINSNKNIKQMAADIELAKTFKQVTDYLFLQPNNQILDFIEVADQNCPIVDENGPTQYLVDIISAVKYEAGDSNGKIHAHGLVEITHKSMLRLDLPMLRKFYNQALGYTPYIDVRCQKVANSDKWLEYMNKNNILTQITMGDNIS